MGCVENVTAEKFPKQGKLVGKPVRVCFHFQTSHTIPGVCLRDDMESPYETLFLLENGRYVRAAECQYTYD